MEYFFPALSAIFLFISFPKYSSGYFAFFALIPFLYILFRTDSYKKASVYGIIFGLVYSSFLNYPLFHALVFNYNKGILYTITLLFFSTSIPYALLYGLFSVSVGYLRTEHNLMNTIIPPSLWIMGDYIREIFPIYLPWAFSGYTQVFTPFIQISDLTGIYGVSFIIILINTLSAQALIQKKLKINFLVLLSIIIPILAYSFFRMSIISKKLDSMPDSNFKKITAIQGNFSSRERWSNDLTQIRYSTYSSMTEQILMDSDIIIWPETVLNSSDEMNIQMVKAVSSHLNNSQLFVSGITRRNNTGNVFNSVIIADNKKIIDIYDKMILFPFSEASYSGLTAGKFLNAPEQFEPGKKQKTISTKHGNIGITLCFESIYPYFVKKLRNNGSGFIINIANDSWFGQTSEPYIHLYTNIARAVELRIPIVRSTNNGITAIIDQRGKLLSRSQLDTRESIKGRIAICPLTSVYSHLGDLIVLFAAMAVLAVIIQKQLKTE